MQRMLYFDIRLTSEIHERFFDRAKFRLFVTIADRTW
jgi:hypothetical protein